MMKPLQWLIAAALSIGLSAAASAQNGTLRGTVTSSKGETLPGVSVKTDGKSFAVVTNANGGYLLSVPAGTYKLVASGMGYKASSKSVTVVAGKGTPANFTKVAFATRKAGDVSVRILNLLGQEVKTLAAGSLEAGNQPLRMEPGCQRRRCC
jgi:iron complex outermembrane receptor protein